MGEDIEFWPKIKYLLPFLIFSPHYEKPGVKLIFKCTFKKTYKNFFVNRSIYNEVLKALSRKFVWERELFKEQGAGESFRKNITSIYLGRDKNHFRRPTNYDKY